ncbi:hypothetical protein [Candidatus Borrarchaeum sp.]|uniref:hypothetical protein n=1 Tax=Candidatus Borrarchaeum sp. TaxID=2846742 RepID=UPI00257E6932|nr:hypothetical protein [Candidatus Borrarchaeum sp.]
MRDYALNVCCKCKRKDWVPVTQEDRDYASKNGGLFIRIVDHGDHFLELHIDCNGAVRREYLSEKAPAKIPASITS